MKLRHLLVPAAMAVVTFSNPVAAQSIGPSTTTDPYVLPASAGVSTMSILTTGDSVGGYRMVGIPDGLGIWKDKDDDDDDDNHGRGRHDENGHAFNLMMDHELGKTSGIVRAHGSTGHSSRAGALTTKL